MTHLPGWTRHDTPEPPDRRRTRLGRDATPPPARASFADCLRESWRSALTVHGGIALAVATLAAIRALYPLGVLMLAISQGGPR